MQAKKHKPAAARVPEKTNFHGKHEVDPITKRSWIEPPKGEKRKENEYCYLPKKHIHTWSGHTKGVNAIRQARHPCLCTAGLVLLATALSVFRIFASPSRKALSALLAAVLAGEAVSERLPSCCHLCTIRSKPCMLRQTT